MSNKKNNGAAAEANGDAVAAAAAVVANGRRKRTRYAARSFMVRVSSDNRARLNSEAKARNVSETMLIESLIGFTLQDQLVSAILDGEPASRGAPS
jgi:predicted HicB family RNase H-like nuclease